MQIDINVSLIAEGLVLKIERYVQRLTQEYSA